MKAENERLQKHIDETEEDKEESIETGEEDDIYYTKEDFENGNIDIFLHDLRVQDTWSNYSVSEEGTVFDNDYEEISYMSFEGEVSQVLKGIVEDDYSYTVTYESINDNGENGYLLYSMGNIINNKSGKCIKLDEGNYIKVYEGMVMPFMKDINTTPFHKIIPVYVEVFDHKDGNQIYSSFDR